jgi:hypothetical protein
MDWKDEMRSHVRVILTSVKEMRMKTNTNHEDDELINAVKSLIKDIEAMSCIRDESLVGDSGHWFGEFTEYEDNLDMGEMIIEWPNLAIGVERIKKILDKLASQ